jgi:3',5'-cyclic AMP phosphodiesterase CpdA
VQPDIFKTTIEELNILSPALVFDVGDMIMGYTDDEKLIAKEWNVFRNTVSALEAPFITVVGNHDIWNKKSEKFYRNLISDRRYFAFWYGGSRFIVLDTEIPGSMNRIEGKQLEWLKSELENNSSGADHIFVFMHKPLWGFNPKYTNWQSEVHPLLVASGVEYVFCGHWHSYNLEVRDGIHYIVTGGGGAELDQGGKQYGGFYHYLLVNVGPEKDDVKVAVVEPGHVYRQDVVLYDTSQRYYKLSNGIHGFPFVETPLKRV